MYIKRAAIGDKNAIFEFINNANLIVKVPEQWNWQFIVNPFVKKGELPICIAVDKNGKVVGQTCSMIEPIKIGEYEFKVGWDINTHVLESQRGFGIGTSLQKLNHQSNKINMSLIITEANRNIKKKFGSIPTTKLYSYVLKFKLDSLENYVNKKIIAIRFFKLTSIYKALLFLINKWLSYKRKNADFDFLSFKTVSCFGKEIDLLWEKLAPEFDCAIIRSSKYLNWKYVEQPNVWYDLFLVEKDKNVVGYLILRKINDHGIIVDFLFSKKNKDVITGALNFAVDYFSREGDYNIRIATSVKEYQECIKKIGIPWPVSAKAPMFFSADPFIINTAKTKNWLLSYGDHNLQQLYQ